MLKNLFKVNAAFIKRIATKKKVKKNKKSENIKLADEKIIGK